MPGRHLPLATDVVNQHTLEAIMNFIDNKNDLLAIMRECHAFYSIGIPFLARMRAESLRQPDLCSFHAFMTRYPDSFALVRELHLRWDGEMTQDEAGYLKDILTGGKSYLKRLSLPCLDRLDPQDAVIRAVASLTELQSFTATSDGSGALRSILSQMQLPSRLTELSLHFNREGLKIHENPVLHIAKFASALKTLKLSGTEFSPADTIYPELAHLEMMLGNTPQLSVFMTAFPNLQTLDVDSDMLPGFSARDNDVECRDQNIAFQDHGHSWPSLKRLSGDPFALYIIGLQQEVEVVSVSSEWTINADNLYCLGAFLSSLRPKSLSLALTDQGDVLSLSFLKGCKNLVELNLSVYFSGEDPLEVGESLESLVGETLRRCWGLRVLSLSLGVDSEGGRPSVARWVLKELDLEDLGDRLKSMLPLERTVIAIKDETVLDTFYPGRIWRSEVTTGE